jgi:hypothetical protein
LLARLIAQAHSKLEPHSVRIDDGINEQAAAIERRKRSVSVNQLVDDFIANRRAKGRSDIISGASHLKKALLNSVPTNGPGDILDISAT